MDEKSRVGKRACHLICWLLPLVIFLVSYSLNMRGIGWAFLHPDERLIAKWVDDTESYPFITDRAYPGGFFELYRPIRAVGLLHDRVLDLSAQWQQQQSQHVPGPKHKKNTLMAVRRTNALFIAISTLFVFLTAKRIFLDLAQSKTSGVPWFAAGLAAWIYGTSPFLVEHAHYGETEGAMVLMGTLTFALLTGALSARDLWRLVVASLTLGFAIGCKYTLLPMVMILPVCAILISRLNGYKMGKTVGFAVLATLLAVVGFCLANPAVYRDFDFFYTGMQRVSSATYGEMEGLLGPMRDVPGAARVLKLRCFLTEAAKIGAIPWIGVLIFLPLWFKSSIRRHVVVLPLFVVCFGFYAVFVFPWFRNQEFIPLLPFLSITLALPVAACGLNRANSLPRNATAMGLILALLALSVCNVMEASKMSSAFAGEESRSALGNWLYASAPEGRKFGFENYTDRQGGYEPVLDSFIAKIEVNPPRFIHEQGLDYIVRSANYTARGTVNPYTGQLYDNFQRALNTFTNQAIRLKSWRIPETKSRPIFSQVDIEVWSANFANVSARSVGSLNTMIDQPYLINFGQYRHTAFDDGYAVGPQQALHISGRTTDVFFRGKRREPWYGVAFFPYTRTARSSSSAEVVWRTSGVTPPKASIPFKTSSFFKIEPSSSFSMFPRERVKFHGDEANDICLLMPYADPVHAARLLRKTGNPQAALALLEQIPSRDLSEAGKAEAFLASRASGCSPKTEWVSAAERVAEVDQISAVSGIPIDVLKDFSRVRYHEIPLGVQGVVPADAAAVVLESEFPVLLTPGKYTVSFRFTIHDQDWLRAFALSPKEISFQLLGMRGDIAMDPLEFGMVNGLSEKIETELVVNAMAIPRFKASLDVGRLKPGGQIGVIHMEDIELTWNPLEMAELSRAEIRKALQAKK